MQIVKDVKWSGGGIFLLKNASWFWIYSTLTWHEKWWTLVVALAFDKWEKIVWDHPDLPWGNSQHLIGTFLMSKYCGQFQGSVPSLVLIWIWRLRRGATWLFLALLLPEKFWQWWSKAYFDFQLNEWIFSSAFFWCHSTIHKRQTLRESIS